MKDSNEEKVKKNIEEVNKFIKESSELMELCENQDKEETLKRLRHFFKSYIPTMEEFCKNLESEISMDSDPTFERFITLMEEFFEKLEKHEKKDSK